MKNFNKSLKKNKGQTLVEFVMLLVVLLTMSTILYTGIKKGISVRWSAIIKTVAAPNVEEIKIQ